MYLLHNYCYLLWYLSIMLYFIVIFVMFPKGLVSTEDNKVILI
jgi:hypothetical protein